MDRRKHLLYGLMGLYIIVQAVFFLQAGIEGLYYLFKSAPIIDLISSRSTFDSTTYEILMFQYIRFILCTIAGILGIRFVIKSPSTRLLLVYITAVIISAIISIPTDILSKAFSTVNILWFIRAIILILFERNWKQYLEDEEVAAYYGGPGIFLMLDEFRRYNEWE